MDRNVPPPRATSETSETVEVWRQTPRRPSTPARWLALAGLAVVVLGLLGWGIWLSMRPAPQILVSPQTVSLGSQVTVNGAGWPRDRQVNIGLALPGSQPTAATVYATVTTNTDQWGVSFPVPDAPPWQGAPLVNVVAFTSDGAAIASQPLTLAPRVAALAVTQTPAVVVVVPATPTATPVAVTPTVVPPLVIVLASPTPAPPTPTGPAPNVNVGDVGILITAPDTSGVARARRLLGPVQSIDAANRVLAVALTSSLAVRTYVPPALPIVDANNQPFDFNAITVGSVVDAQGVDNGQGVIIAQRMSVLSRPNPNAPAAPTPTAAPVTFTGWRGELYANPTLAGAPTLVRDDPDLNFNWVDQPPAPGLPADGFSARWTRTVDLPAGNYLFQARGDGGVRVWLDGWQVINNWQDGPGTWMGDFLSVQAGPHVVQVEYFDASGAAALQVAWEPFAGYPEWRGEYYANLTLAGAPSLLRNDAAVQFDWGDGAPAPGFPADGFSARWTRTVPLENGTYRFRGRASGGLRLWVDETLVLDAWQNGINTPTVDVQKITAGPHRIRVEYANASGPAQVAVGWEKLP